MSIWLLFGDTIVMRRHIRYVYAVIVASTFFKCVHCNKNMF